MKRKLFILLLAMISVFACAFGLSACGSFGDSGNEGSYNENNNVYGFVYSPTEDGYCVSTEEERITDIKSITIPSQYNGKPVTALGDYFLYGVQTEIDTVVIPESIKRIGLSAFSDCTNLKNVTFLGDSISLGDNAFAGSKIDNLILSINIDEAGSAVFVGAEIEYATLSASAVNALYVENAGPEIKNIVMTDGTFIEEHTFFFNRLQTIVLPQGLTEIKAGAFRACSELRSVISAEGLTYIGEEAFYECENLTDINLGEGLTKISDYSFYFCSSLRTVSIPQSVTSIGSSAFSRCSSLTSVTLSENLTSIGSNAFSWCSSLTSVTLSENLTSIGECAFYECSSLIDITIPDSVTLIGSSAFSYCSSLKSITIPEKVISIGSRAFSYCSSLTEINYNAEDCGNFGSDSSIFEYVVLNNGFGNMVLNGDSITFGDMVLNGDGITLNIGAKVKTLPSMLFFNMRNNLIALIFDKNSICDSLMGLYPNFYFYTNLRSAVVPAFIVNLLPQNIASLTIISGEVNADSMLGNFRSLTQENFIVYDGVTFGAGVFSGCEWIRSFALPEGTTEIADYEFSGCVNLEEIIIPDSVISIGEYAFQDCNSLTGNEYENAIYLGSSVNPYMYLLRVTDNSVISVNTNENTKWIAAGAFSDLTMLESVVMPDNLITIGGNAFLNCASLKSIIIPDSVMRIGDGAFNGCASLNGIIIPENVKYIGERAFMGCASLTSVTIPDSVDSVGNYAFSNCTSIESMVIGSVGACGYSILSDCPGLRSVAVPAELISSLPSNVTKVTVTGGDIAVNAFLNLGEITELIISDEVTSIAVGALKGLGKIEKLTTPYFMTKQAGVLGMMFGLEAFIGASATDQVNGYNTVDSNGATGIYTITHTYYIPDSLTSVTVTQGLTFGAFSNCVNIKEVYYTNCTDDTVVGVCTFYGCSGLETVMLPDTLNSIQYYAFEGCSSLTTVYCLGTEWTCDVYGGNDPWETKTTYYYSEIEPTEDGNYWHYVDGVVTVW